MPTSSADGDIIARKLLRLIVCCVEQHTEGPVVGSIESLVTIDFHIKPGAPWGKRKSI